MLPLKVFAINLPKREDRRKHIEDVFSKNDFELTVFSCIYHEKPNVSLWLSIQEIIKRNKNEPFTIICEDDHDFNIYFSIENLIKQIDKCSKIEADILLGGVSWFDLCYPVNEYFSWINLFNGTQFMVIYNKFYKRILESNFSEEDQADFFISSLSKNIFVSFPPFSVQKEFGYSDITSENSRKSRLNNLFERSENRLFILNKIKNFYY